MQKLRKEGELGYEATLFSMWTVTYVHVSVGSLAIQKKRSMLTGFDLQLS